MQLLWLGFCPEVQAFRVGVAAGVGVGVGVTEDVGVGVGVGNDGGVGVAGVGVFLQSGIEFRELDTVTHELIWSQGLTFDNVGFPNIVPGSAPPVIEIVPVDEIFILFEFPLSAVSNVHSLSQTIKKGEEIKFPSPSTVT